MGRTFLDHGQNLHDDIRRAERIFYVHDLLLSLDPPSRAVSTFHSLRQLLRKGRFRLTEGMCNHKKVNDGVPLTKRAVDVKEVLEDHNPG